jgi:hypothetical protein
MEIKIKFEGKPDMTKAKVAARLCRATAMYISLPKEIIIEFVELANHIYGETSLESLSKRTIRINDRLSTEDMIIPILHELAHISQIFERRLNVTRNGQILWEGKKYSVDQSKLSYQEYQNLPWEVEAVETQQSLLGKLIL